MVLTCDGASVNRRMWKLHGDGEEVVYKVDNVFAPETKRPIFFVSDPPHLLKMILNCLANKKKSFG